MEIQLETIEVAALALPLGERAALAQRLLESLDEDAEIEAAWDAEIAHRVLALESGEMHTVALTEITSRLRAAFK
jgi:putative addiction module component (TIGR02574 family)